MAVFLPACGYLDNGPVTDREQKAVAALIEAGSDTDPWSGPVQYMGSKLGFPTTAEARLFVEGHLDRNLIRTVNVGAANDMMETGHVVPMRFAWEKIPINE